MCLISWCAGAKAPAVIGFVGVDLCVNPINNGIVGKIYFCPNYVYCRGIPCGCPINNGNVWAEGISPK